MLEVLSAVGLVHRVVAPKLGQRKFGVPPGGAWDREAFILAWALVGQDKASDGWEVLGQATFQARRDLTIGFVGNEGYSRALSEGDRITLTNGYIATTAARLSDRRLLETPERRNALRVVAGPQAALFDLAKVVSGQYSVSLATSRVGTRLNGDHWPNEINMTSEPACVGAVQITGSGQLIVLGPDGPTIGGYPKAMVVCDADLDYLPRLSFGEVARFDLVTFEEAERASRERAQRIARRVAELVVTCR